MRAISAIGPVVMLVCFFIPDAARAQTIGTFRWQLAPYCNVLSLTVTQVDVKYRFEGFDDRCGTGTPATVTGLAVPAAGGTLAIGLTVVGAGAPEHVDVAFNLGPLGGPWRDNGGQSGSFAWFPSGVAGGAPRPAVGITSVTAGPGLVGGGGTGGVTMSVDPLAVQSRINGACAAGQYVRSVGADGSVTCGADATLALSGPGVATTAARGDHTHLVATAAAGNTAVGPTALQAITSGQTNTALGRAALEDMTSGNDNVALGSQALRNSTTASGNVAVGSASMFVAATGNNNTAIGTAALLGTGGSRNIAIGYSAGGNIGAGDDNIAIGNPGTPADTAAIRIGTLGSQTAAYLAGVSGVNVTGAQVYVAGDGKLGVAVSSRRFKEQIAPIGDTSSVLQALRPVSFFYKPEFAGGERIRQYGLIAEQVDEVMPELVIRDANGQIQTVRYQFLVPMMLAEIQRLEQARAQMAEELAALRALATAKTTEAPWRR